MRRTITLLAFLLAALLVVPAAIAQDAGESAEYDDDTVVVPDAPTSTEAVRGEQYNTHCWRPSPSHHARCFRHFHSVEIRNNPDTLALEWRPRVAVVAWIPATSSYIRYNIAHTSFCSHYGFPPNVGVHSCADMPGQSNNLQYTYYFGSWRARNSGGSYDHATSSGCHGSSTSDGIQLRFEPGTSTEHLTNWYFGASAIVDLATSPVVAYSWRPCGTA
jgi:hypothetical protein